MKRFGLAALLALLFSMPCLGQGAVTGQETTISYTGTNVPIVNPNTPVSQFNSPGGTNTFIIPLSSPTVSLRVYITNNTANACPSAFTAQLWAASDPQVISFNNSPANWQVIPIQNSTGNLIQAINPAIPASGAVYFSSAVISAPKVVLQLTSTTGACPTTSVEVTGVVSNVAVTSPLISANSPASFSGANSSQVQGIVPQGTTAANINPVVTGGVEPPINTNFTPIGIDNFFGGSAPVAINSNGIFPVISFITPSNQGEFGIVLEANIGATTGTTSPIPPWVCFPGWAGGCGSTGTVSLTTLSNVSLQTPYRRQWTNSAGPGNDDAIAVLFSNPSTSIRAAIQTSVNVLNFPFVTGDTVLEGFICSGTAICQVQSITGSGALAGLIWKKVSQVYTPGTQFSGLEIWAATSNVTSSGNGSTTVTFSNGGSTQGNLIILTGTSPSQLTTPVVSTSADAIGNQVVRLDAQAPNQFTCSVTLSTNSTAACQPAPITFDNVSVRNYITDIQIQTTLIGTTENVTIVTGTGVNCATGTVNLSAMLYPVTTVGIQSILGARTPLVAPIGNSVCVSQAGTAAATITVELRGFIAP